MDNKIYDIVIVGSGLGGLASSIILAKEGLSVCVLEKNNQFGGNLQTFSRNKTIFDTGVHYLGGLEKGQNLYRYFDYLGIVDELRLKRMDMDGYDIVTFGMDKTVYPHAQGYDNFVEQLIPYFPEEEVALRRYVKDLQDTCAMFPLYHISMDHHYDVNILGVNAKCYFEQLTSNVKLRAVLAGTSLLYAGDGDKTPFYVHALSVNSYIQSAYRCINGGSQITKLLLRELRKSGGEAFRKTEIVDFEIVDNKIVSVVSKDGLRIQGKRFISNIDPKTTLQMIGREHFRKAYYSRVQELQVTTSSFSIFLVLKKDVIPYRNNNLYYSDTYDQVWITDSHASKSWPANYMLSMGVSVEDQMYADSMTCITFMDYEEVKQWENTYNTVLKGGDRDDAYQQFKQEKIDRFIDKVEEQYPGLREAIRYAYASTPLSYRDYIGVTRGNLYGHVKDSNHPLKHFIAPKSKIENLFFTGQGVNMHGILGVTIGAAITCSEMLGADYLIRKIGKHA